MGGRSFEGVTANVDVFDNDQSWSRAPHLPRNLQYPAAVTIDDRWIVVTSGLYFYDDMNTETYVYDIKTNQWMDDNIMIPVSPLSCFINVSN